MSKNRITHIKDDEVEISALCTVTKERYSVTVCRDQYNKWLHESAIQFAMPDLSVEQREFIKTGFTPAEWKAIFGEEE